VGALSFSCSLSLVLALVLPTFSTAEYVRNSAAFYETECGGEGDRKMCGCRSSKDKG
jgi:hypothetical protein